MKHKRLKTTIVVLFNLSLAGLQAQECISATGGNISGSGGSVSYTAGLVAYQTHSGANVSVSEGVQHGYQISVVSENEHPEFDNIQIDVFPNPVSGFLTLRIDEKEIADFSYLLFDMHGNQLQNELVSGNQTIIDMDRYVPAGYFVKIIQGIEEVKTFIIIKK